MDRARRPRDAFVHQDAAHVVRTGAQACFHTLSTITCPVVAITPIIARRAIKGPTAKLMAELGIALTAASVAAFYRGIATGFVLDRGDAALEPEIAAMGIATTLAPAFMADIDSKMALARIAIAFGRGLRR